MRQRILDVTPVRRLVMESKPLQPSGQSKGKQFRALAYRELLDDGNSFYRALSIAYLSVRKQKECSRAFPGYKELNLCISSTRNLPFEVYPHYEKEDLRELLELSWADFISFHEQSPVRDYESNLCEFINGHMVLDVLLILYVRAVGSKFIVKGLREDPKAWRSTAEVDVCEYGNDCPKSAVNAFSQALSLNLEMWSLTKETVSKEQYFSSPLCSTVSLFCKGNVYGIVDSDQNNQNILREPDVEPPAKTKDCDRCPFMSSGWCFRCSMLNFDSPAYFKVSGVQPLKAREVAALPQQLGAPIERRKESKGQKEKIKVAPDLPAEAPRCLECNETLKKDQQEILLCKECTKSARIEERVLEYRSRTMEKVKSPKPDFKSRAPIRPAIFDSIWGGPNPSRLAELRKKY